MTMSGTIPTLPSDGYGYLILAAVASISILIWKGIQVGRSRKQNDADVQYQSMYGKRVRFNCDKSATVNGKHLSLTVRNGVAVVRLQSPGKVNVLNLEVQDEMIVLAKKIETDGDIVATVIISDKPECFIAGADITMLEKVENLHDAVELSRGGQKFMNDLENSKKPTVAAIQGSCLGGGLELALACQYRVAINDKKTGFGVPEVMLGLLPGAGGTQRLPKLAGLPTALDMMLTGRTLRTDRAKKVGIVDLAIEPLVTEGEFSEREHRTLEYLEDIAVQVAYDLSLGKLKPDRTKSTKDKIMAFTLTFNYVKDKVFEKAKAQVMKISKGLYPAPLKILEVVRTGVDKGAQAGYEAEASAFGELVLTPESRGLISLFHGQTECKKNRFGHPQRTPMNLAVLGAGLMGADIVQGSADKGYSVIFKDTTEEGLAHGYNQICTGYDGARKRKKITQAEQEQIMSSISFQLDYKNFDKVDMIIEAVFEDLSLKPGVIKEVEALIPEHCIVAANSVVLPVGTIALMSSRPDKVIGMHYFNLIDKMQLVEIVATPETSEEAVASALQVGLKQGRVVITVTDGPGFYITRILSEMIAELIRLLQEGVNPEKIDKLTVDFGFLVGASTLVDVVGLDVATRIVKEMAVAVGARASGGSPQLLQDLVNEGHLGKKSGKGIFVYEKGNKGRPTNPTAQTMFSRYRLEPKLELLDDDILMRMVVRFVNEALLCLEEKILANPLEGDVGAVFGLGFPPFTGGPFHYVDKVGAQFLVDKMKKYEAAYGAAFTPCQLLLDHANSCKKFFPAK